MQFSNGDRYPEGDTGSAPRVDTDPESHEATDLAPKADPEADAGPAPRVDTDPEAHATAEPVLKADPEPIAGPSGVETAQV